MSSDSVTLVGVTVAGFVATWAIWVTVSIFTAKTQIALMKLEIKVMEDVKAVLHRISEKLP